MFKLFAKKLHSSIKKLTQESELNENNIKQALLDTKKVFLEANVSLTAIEIFINKLKQNINGIKVYKKFTPYQTFMFIVEQELKNLLGSDHVNLNFKHQPPIVILITGLQGVGKTTTTAKLAYFIQKNYKKKIIVTSADVYRPSAILQLKLLVQNLKNIDFYNPDKLDTPIEIVSKSLDYAQKKLSDILIIDTAGRLHIDNNMMNEIKQIHQKFIIHETLFVADSLTGQDASISSKSFDNIIPLTGIILTKIDGDSKGGAAMSIKSVVNKPIKFIGTGENISDLEYFYPNRIASQILGKGDLSGLMQQSKIISQNVAKNKNTKEKFNFKIFKQHLIGIIKMGGINKISSKLPNIMSQNNKYNFNQNFSNVVIKKMIAMIDSMTKKEKINPDIIKYSRKIRITKGSGTTIQDINKLIKYFINIKKINNKANLNKNFIKNIKTNNLHNLL